MQVQDIQTKQIPFQLRKYWRDETWYLIQQSNHQIVAKIVPTYALGDGDDKFTVLIWDLKSHAFLDYGTFVDEDAAQDVLWYHFEIYEGDCTLEQ